MKITHILNVSNNIDNYFEDDKDLDIEYLRINIEDNSDVPIILSFPVAFQFLENAFSECNLMTRDKSKRHSALVDSNVQMTKDAYKQRGGGLFAASLLSPVQVDFVNNKS